MKRISRKANKKNKTGAKKRLTFIEALRIYAGMTVGVWAAVKKKALSKTYCFSLVNQNA